MLWVLKRTLSKSAPPPPPKKKKKEKKLKLIDKEIFTIQPRKKCQSGPICIIENIICLVSVSALFAFLGLIVYVAKYSNSDHISSAYGLTWCSFFGCVIAGALFLWDKIELDKKMKELEANKRTTAPSRARSTRSVPFSQRSRRSHARSQLSVPNSQRSVAQSTEIGVASSHISTSTKK